MRRRPLVADRGTIALGAVAGAAVAAVVAGEVSRVWRRGSAPLPSEASSLLLAAEEAVAETAQVARAGYREVSTRENAMFNLLTSFVGTFIAARVITHVLRDRARVGPFRNVRVRRRHIHHFVPGIVIAFGAGAVAILSRDERFDSKLAVPFGVGLLGAVHGGNETSAGRRAQLAPGSSTACSPRRRKRSPRASEASSAVTASVICTLSRPSRVQ